MLVGRVVGALWCTKKLSELGGLPLLLVEPETGGPPLVAADELGAGPGEQVLVTQGPSAQLWAGQPIDARIVGIIDGAESWKEGAHDHP